MPRQRLKSILITATKVILLTAAAVFVGKVFWDNWPAFRAGWRPPKVTVAAAVATLALSYFFLMFLSQRVLRGVGWDLSLRSVMRPFFYTLLGRYIPGRFAVVVGKVYLYEKRGVPRLESVLAPAYENVFAAAGGIAAALVAAVTLFGAVFSYWQILSALAALTCVVIAAYPAVTRRAVSFLVRRFDRTAPPPRVINARTALSLSGSYFVYCFLLGMFFTLLASSFYDLGWGAAAKVGAAYTAASVMGYVVVLTPSGLGVRESLLILLLGSYIPPGDAAFLAVVARVMTLTMELVLAGTALVWGDDHTARPIGDRPPRKKNAALGRQE